jgi:hypothetical protein
MREDAMTNEPNPDDVRNLWQNQAVEKVTITVDEIRQRATRFERRIYWRNVREYTAGVVVVAFLSIQLRTARGWQLAPLLLLIVGTIYVLIQLHRRGSSRPVPADLGIKASMEFHRVELERQRDAVRSVWRWYLLPFMPGFIATWVQAGLQHGVTGRLVISGVILIVLLVAVWWLNQSAARKLDRKIADLKAMESEHE